MASETSPLPNEGHLDTEALSEELNQLSELEESQKTREAYDRCVELWHRATEMGLIDDSED